MSQSLMTYKAQSGAQVKLSPAIVRNYLVSGSAAVSDQEVLLFMMLCRDRGLNPFLREAYLIKYGNEAASMVVGYDVYKQRATQDHRYKGHNAGVIVEDKNGEIQHRNGCFALRTDSIVGGWCTVYRDGMEPLIHEVPFDEYAVRKKDGTLNRQWSTKPGTMIRKVAVAQALREAFPENLSQMYMAEEFRHSEDELPKGQVVVETYEDDLKGGYKPDELYLDARTKRAFLSAANDDAQIVQDAAAACGYNTIDDVPMYDCRKVYDKICEIVKEVYPRPEKEAPEYIVLHANDEQDESVICEEAKEQ